MLHKLHSLLGIVPIGAFLLWHMVIKGSYRTVERVFFVACAFYVSYLVSGFMAGPDWRQAMHGSFPNTDRAAHQTVWLPQTALLGDEQDLHEIAAAVRKIQENYRELR